MDEAVQASVSPTAIWVIVVVAVSCLAFWLTMMALASRDPSGRHGRMPSPQGPVLGGTHVSFCRRSVAPSRVSEAVFTEAETNAVLAARLEPMTAPGPLVPDQRVTGPSPAPHVPEPPPVPTPRTVPAPRTGDVDQPQSAGTSG